MDGAVVEHQAAAQEPHDEGAGSRAHATTQGTLVDEAARVAATLNDKLPTLSQETRIPGQNHGGGAPEATREPTPAAHEENREAFMSHDAPPPRAHASHAEESAASAEDIETATITPVAQTEARGGRMRQRAASVGASVGGNLRPRVEKLREASTVVFDEASDDPGLRFVIIAALLFLLFLFILLFSYILG
jgi:hypothetical protein